MRTPAALTSDSCRENVLCNEIVQQNACLLLAHENSNSTAGSAECSGQSAQQCRQICAFRSVPKKVCLGRSITLNKSIQLRGEGPKDEHGVNFRNIGRYEKSILEDLRGAFWHISNETAILIIRLFKIKKRCNACNFVSK